MAHLEVRKADDTVRQQRGLVAERSWHASGRLDLPGRPSGATITRRTRFRRVSTGAPMAGVRGAGTATPAQYSTRDSKRQEIATDLHDGVTVVERQCLHPESIRDTRTGGRSATRDELSESCPATPKAMAARLRGRPPLGLARLFSGFDSGGGREPWRRQARRTAPDRLQVVGRLGSISRRRRIHRRSPLHPVLSDVGLTAPPSP